MTRSKAISGIVLLLGVGAVAAVVLRGAGGAGAAAQGPTAADTVPAEVDLRALEGPTQPVFFRHDIHAGLYEIPCQYCHSHVAESPNPGIPSMETCMGCHLVVRGGTPTDQAEIKKVTDAWTEGRVIEWVRVHTVPQHARFPHMVHVKELGPDSCAECHGEVRAMPQVHRVSSLQMGWCVRCHVERDVTRDCTACHY